ncbi:MAG TPA: pyruvate formate lyase family protein [Candidatus Brocadiia bacterium]|nr:pyruvate formate lyase family protein [Candidatus Brocadiia bacterium]
MTPTGNNQSRRELMASVRDHCAGRRTGWLQILREIGEYYAEGFYRAEFAGKPLPMRFAEAISNTYRNMPVEVPEKGLLIPRQPFGNPDGEPWRGGGMILHWQHSAGPVLAPREVVAARKTLFPEYAEFIDMWLEEWSRRRYAFGGYTHSNPDYPTVLAKGLLGMRAELLERSAAARRDEPDNRPKLDLYDALIVYVEGVEAWHRRQVAAVERAASSCANPARKSELERLIPELRRSLLHPAESFYQAVLTAHWVWLLDPADNYGHLDQYLESFWRADMESGRTDRRMTEGLLDEVFDNMNRVGGWNVAIGGTRPDGSVADNPLTIECIRSVCRVRQLRPNLALRVSSKTDDSLLVEALKCVRLGTGRPALYNDDLYIKSLMDSGLGLAIEDARDYAFGGCTETMIPGRSNCGSLDGELNLAQCLERALWNGRGLADGSGGVNCWRQAGGGPTTGFLYDHASFDDLLAAFRRQVDFATDQVVAWLWNEHSQRPHSGDPKLARTFFTSDCVRSGLGFEAGGARYNWSVITYHGIANAADSLIAVRELVYEKKEISARQLLDALKADFEGHEDLRWRIQKVRRFGNDDPVADDVARDVAEYAWKRLREHVPFRGGRYLPSVILFATYDAAGRNVGALPDGRKSAAPLVDSVGPFAGRDVNGPTAMLNSVARLPLHLAVGTPILNMRLAPKIMESDDDLRKIAAMIRAFFIQGGMQIQFTVVDPGMLRRAQAKPEEFRDLVIRIGGYSEYFVRLSRELQDSVIARTEHGS